MQPDNPLELDDGVDLDPLCPVCNDTGLIPVGHEHMEGGYQQTLYEPCACRWER